MLFRSAINPVLSSGAGSISAPTLGGTSRSVLDNTINVRPISEDFLKNLGKAVPGARRKAGEEETTTQGPRSKTSLPDYSGTMEKFPIVTDNIPVYSNRGVGAIGTIGSGNPNLAMPNMSVFQKPTRSQVRAENPNNYFGLSQPSIDRKSTRLNSSH